MHFDFDEVVAAGQQRVAPADGGREAKGNVLQQGCGIAEADAQVVPLVQHSQGHAAVPVAAAPEHKAQVRVGVAKVQGIDGAAGPGGGHRPPLGQGNGGGAGGDFGPGRAAQGNGAPVQVGTVGSREVVVGVGKGGPHPATGGQVAGQGRLGVARGVTAVVVAQGQVQPGRFGTARIGESTHRLAPAPVQVQHVAGDVLAVGAGGFAPSTVPVPVHPDAPMESV